MKSLNFYYYTKVRAKEKHVDVWNGLCDNVYREDDNHIPSNHVDMMMFLKDG